MSARLIFSLTVAVAWAVAPHLARAQDARAPAAALPAPGGNAAAIAAQAVAGSAQDPARAVPAAAPVTAATAPPEAPAASAPPAAAAPAASGGPSSVPSVVSEGSLGARATPPAGLGIAPPGSAVDAGDKPMALLAGLYRCELSRSVTIRRVAADGKSLVLNWAGRDHDFLAVEARTGALRFENVSEGMVWLVIIGKAMLLDTRKGRQLANECRH